MLSEEDRRRIHEEERLRQQIRGYSPTDWLASCLLAPIIIAAALVVLVVTVVFLLVVKGWFWP